ncbi:glutamine--fructose-6-phosphate transaminase (isomerizing) [Acidihalobacter prosperus]|uniref:Glutamine--fructose-6-phosphate aminotransferase [isomerizing] n=1 Tax=Acidihalobacter prosperus TaxID=160660 RepID=A0A1A6C4S4_9GAMM|nr:glutamine--fructose-6-phosphate transaminase (isomerizing) [Acidihalobacter prosperus]OBS09554.1 Glucosamine--fructose-6-phosphate aminotransferase [Acidihalobacter prosperus]
MCGIVAGIAERNVQDILLEGLRRLEYRGYDSAGLAVLDEQNQLHRRRRVGKVAELGQALAETPLIGKAGIAHTRWATHGSPTELNAHPHISSGRVAIVHNGIIENHAPLRAELKALGYNFESETDTEVAAHRIAYYLDRGDDLLQAVQHVVAELEGAYALAVIACDDPGRVVACRNGPPLVVGFGIGEHFVASDVQALLPVTQRFSFLENGEVVDLRRDEVAIYDREGDRVMREIRVSGLTAGAIDRGQYRHFMQKEIFEQPFAISETLEGRVIEDRPLSPGVLGVAAEALLPQIEAVQIVACGTSYHAGMIARYWMEEIANIPCQVEVASEYRYRRHVVLPNSLFLTLSQSGETADTLAAVQASRDEHYLARLAICNVPESSLVRESELVLLTHAGPEIGVASTKAFTTQLVALMQVVLLLAQSRGADAAVMRRLRGELLQLPGLVEKALALDPLITRVAERYVERGHALFLGRGAFYPVAMEGALKLKEISYIHAEAYPAGELKHGPLALVDADMPVIAVAPNNDMLEKLKSNLEEVRARGGELFVFAEPGVALENGPGMNVIEVPGGSGMLAPVLMTVPLQLLAYHTAVFKGTDVDQPRNLAKSVTVE